MRIKPEFDRRNAKIIGLSVDPTDDHAKWASDIEETQGYAPNYPTIGDDDFAVSKLYGLLPATTSGDPHARTPADNQTVRNVFVIGPDKKVKLILVYPMTGRNFDEVLRVIDSLQRKRLAPTRLRADADAKDYVVFRRLLPVCGPARFALPPGSRRARWRYLRGG